MLVKNNTLSLHRIALSSVHGHHIDLFPGVNTVADSDWAAASVNPMVALRVKVREYEPLKSATVTPELVEQTVNPAALDDFAKSKNKKIKNAVAAQKAKLEIPAPPGVE